jgi:CRISPR-associated protein Cas5d
MDDNGTRVRVRVAGEFACFSRPEMKVERVSYEVMTPSAARGILDAILWRPEMRWVVKRIEVLRPIRFVSLRRNEIQRKVAPRSVAQWIEDPTAYVPQAAGAGSDDATPRNTLALRDVVYVVEAEPFVFEPGAENHPTKYMAMFNRRVEKGQCFHRPYLGCREFACDFTPPDPAERPLSESRDLGLMLYDIAFKREGNRAHFFRAKLEAGVLDTDPARVLPNGDEEFRCLFKR